MDQNTSNSTLPTHLAVIMDGNGRWAKAKGLPRLKGHEEGAKRVIDIAEEAKRLGIHYLSLFAFSTENWKRSQQEVEGLFIILETFAKQYKQRLLKVQIRFVVSGDILGLPKTTQKVVRELIEETKNFHGYILNVCLNYGGTQELVEMSKRIAKKVANGDLPVEAIQESTLFSHTWLGDLLPPIDCLIRTSGEQRLSNFMLLHLAYSELIFVENHWPDFTVTVLHEVLDQFSHRQRRFGKES